MRKDTNEEKQMIKLLNRNATKIEEINNSRTKSMLDMHNHGKSYFINDDWQEEIIANYKFFISMIGLLEARIIGIARNIRNNSNSSIELSNHLDNLINKRQKIVSHYKEQAPEQDLDIIKNIIDKPFTFEHLGDIYADLEIENYKYNLHQEFIDAYNTGSKLSQNCDIKKIYLLYTRLYLTVTRTKVTNSEKIHKTGNEKVLRNILHHKNNIEKNREG